MNLVNAQSLAELIEVFIAGSDRSRAVAGKIELALGDLFGEAQPFADLSLMLAGYTPGGGRYLYDEAQIVAAMRPVLAAVRSQISRFLCPCCGFRTLESEPPGSYEICPVCFWEDDQIQFEDPTYEGGANAESLNEARANFLAFGAYSRTALSHVRPPLESEKP